MKPIFISPIRKFFKAVLRLKSLLPSTSKNLFLFANAKKLAGVIIEKLKNQITYSIFHKV